MAAASGSHKLVTTTVPRYNWVPDSQRKRCVNKACNTKFTTAVRRHHCRFCGEIFCGKCLSKHKGFLACAPCREKTEGKVILHQTKKERKAKAKEAIYDLKSKITAERHKTPEPAVTTSKRSSGSSTASAQVKRTSTDSPGTVQSVPVKKKPPTPKTVEVRRVSGQTESLSEHTATFSTAPSRKPEPETRSRPSSLSLADDPFSVGGGVDDFDSDEEDYAGGDIGDITTQSTRQAPADHSDDEPPPGDDDFAAMLAAADDLQGE